MSRLGVFWIPWLTTAASASCKLTSAAAKDAEVLPVGHYADASSRLGTARVGWGSHDDHPRRAGHPISARALAHARLVAAIFCENNSSNALVMLSGRPPSMISLSGKP